MGLLEQLENALRQNPQQISGKRFGEPNPMPPTPDWLPSPDQIDRIIEMGKQFAPPPQNTESDLERLRRKFLDIEEYTLPPPLPPKPKFVPTPDMIEGEDYYRPLIYDNTGTYYGDPVDLRDRVISSGGSGNVNNSGLLQLLRGLK